MPRNRFAPLVAVVSLVGVATLTRCVRTPPVASIPSARIAPPAETSEAAARSDARKLVPPYPTPPRQLVAWTPPAAQLPPLLVSAIERLFAFGLADPRGCDYRQVELVTGSVWCDGGTPTKTHAWVLPGVTPPAAVAWNGLVYRPTSVGDPADVVADALADYGSWMATTSSEGELFDVPSYFEPMWRFPRDPAVVRAARAAFGAKSGWLPLIPTTKSAAGFAWNAVELVRSPLLGVPAFREAVLAELSVTAKAGSLRMRSSDVSVEMLAGWSTGENVDANDPLTPPAGTTQDIRVCDAIAAAISVRDGAPAFRRYWPVKNRDAALVRMRAYVRALP